MAVGEPPGWVSQIMEQWRSAQPSSGRITYDGSAPDVPGIIISVVRDVEINLHAVPEGCAFRIHVEHPGSATNAQRVTLRLLDRSAQVIVSREDLTQSPPPKDLLWLTDSVGGTVRVRNGSTAGMQLPIGADLGCNAALTLETGLIVLSPTLPRTVKVQMTGGTTVVSGPLNQLALAGTAALGATGRSARVGSLWIAEESVLQSTPHGEPPVIGTVRSRSGQTKLVLDPSAQPTGSWVVQEAFDVSFESTLPARIRGITRAERVKCSGPVDVQFEAGSEADQIEFERTTSGVPKVSAWARAILTGVCGEVAVGEVIGAHLAGSRASVELASVEPGGFGQSVLTGFKLPRGLHGRQMLSEMASAYNLDPSSQNLPGWDRRWFWSVLGPARYLQSPVPREANSSRGMHHDAEFLRELQRLVIEKGAPGSTRSRVGWCAYRLRELTATWPERLALSVYRCLGYGERPLPAFLTWLLVAFISAAIVLGEPFDPSLHGLGRLGLEAAQQASGPLAGVLHGGEGSVEHDWEYLLRAAVAVPLVTGLLALRNYVKSKPS